MSGDFLYLRLSYRDSLSLIQKSCFQAGCLALGSGDLPVSPQLCIHIWVLGIQSQVLMLAEQVLIPTEPSP